MKILLTAINAKYIHSGLAVYLLRAYAEPEAEGIRIREFTINQHREDILSEIVGEQPDVVLCSCYIWNIRYIRELLADIPRVLPDTDIWLGGPEVSYNPEQVMKDNPAVRGILIGEGEATFRELILEYYQKKRKSLEKIAGICFRNQEKKQTAGQISSPFRKEEDFVRTAPRPLLSMDEIPFVYTEALLREFQNRIVYYESSRGCPFGCSYCLSSVDKTVRYRSVQTVFREIQFFLDHCIPQVKFVDRTFNLHPDRTLQILTYLLRHDNKVTNFHFEIAADLLTEEEMEIMAQMRPGLIQLETGVQSTNLRTLQAIGRKTDLKSLRRNTVRIHAMGNIHQHLDLIAGLPWEDYDSFAKSFCDVYAMRPDQLQLGFLKLLKGSPLQKEAEKYGIVCQAGPPYEVLYTSQLTYQQIRRLKKIEEMTELFYNSHQFTGTIKVLELCFANSFAMYESLAGYYEEQGFFVNSPSRQYRYKILLSFAKKHDPDREELYRELLICDLYLRENLKSRPFFASDLRPYRQIINRLRESMGVSPTDHSLHAEPFFYPVWEEDPMKISTRLPAPVMVLFDYRNRNPLSHNAKMTCLI